MAGRPTVFTPEVIRKIEEVAALDGSVEEMAYYAGIKKATLYSKLEDDKEFSDRINALRERPVLLARQTVMKALAANSADARWYLEKKKKKEFGNTIDITTKGEKLTDADPRITDLTKKLNALYQGRSFGSDGAAPGAVGTQTPDKE
jgi:hypothetical protein